jgi:hypothetical protein
MLNSIALQVFHATLSLSRWHRERLRAQADQQERWSALRSGVRDLAWQKRFQTSIRYSQQCRPFGPAGQTWGQDVSERLIYGQKQEQFPPLRQRVDGDCIDFYEANLRYANLNRAFL